MDHAQETSEHTTAAATTTTTTTTTAPWTPTSPPGPWEYLVGVVIGEGSFGRVVYGKHKKTGQDVAIKVVDLYSCRKHPILVAALRREQSILRQLEQTCSFIVQLLSSFVDAHCVYIIMECCKGGTLQDLFQSWHNDNSNLEQEQQSSADHIRAEQQQQEWSRLLGRYTGQIIEALRALHLLGYIHGDLNPSNVLITGDGKQVRLADFGSALSLNGDDDDNDNEKPQQERPGCAWQMTTTDYACPELLKGKIRAQVSVDDFRSNGDSSFTTENMKTMRIMAADVWSLGCLLFAAWHGQSPFHAASDALAIQAIQEYAALETGEAQKQWLINQRRVGSPEASAIDEKWLEVAHDFLSPDPEQRFYSARHDTVGDSTSANFLKDSQGLSREDWINKLHDCLSMRQKVDSNVCLGDTEDDLECSTSLSLFQPSWWVKQQQQASHEFRDGAVEGWAAYLV